MKLPSAALCATSLLFIASCDPQQNQETSRKIDELEAQAKAATERQQELERQLQDQKLANERDAVERERAQLEWERIDLQRQNDEARAAASEALARRELELAAKEGQLDQLQSTLEQQQQQLDDLSAELSEQELQLAGTQAVESTAGPSTTQLPVADYNTFYTSLASYGSWFETSDYGYVWQPAVVRDSSWRPYTRGRWACTDYGWTWISDEPFGWATYHYGRWALLHGRGWVWVPGTTWAPSWVTWRYGDDYVGWAPLPPETLAYSTHTWGSSVEVTFGIGPTWFNFVRTTHFGSPIRSYCLPSSRNHIYLGRSVNITNIYTRHGQVYCGGPRYKEFQRPGHHPVPYYRLDRRSLSGKADLARKFQIHDRTLQIYAPNVDRKKGSSQRPGIVRGRIESPRIDRVKPISPEIQKRYRDSMAHTRGNPRTPASDARPPLTDPRNNNAATPDDRRPKPPAAGPTRQPNPQQTPIERPKHPGQGTAAATPPEVEKPKRPGPTERPKSRPKPGNTAAPAQKAIPQPATGPTRPRETEPTRPRETEPTRPRQTDSPPKLKPTQQRPNTAPQSVPKPAKPIQTKRQAELLEQLQTRQAESAARRSPVVRKPTVTPPTVVTPPRVRTKTTPTPTRIPEPTRVTPPKTSIPKTSTRTDRQPSSYRPSSSRTVTPPRVQTTPVQPSSPRSIPQTTTPPRTSTRPTTPSRVTPQRVTPQRTTPQRTTPQRVTPQRTTPQRVTPQRTTPQRVTPQRTTPSPSRKSSQSSRSSSRVIPPEDSIDFRPSRR